MKHQPTPNYLDDAYQQGLDDAMYLLDHLNKIATPVNITKYLPEDEANEWYMRKARLEMILNYLKQYGVNIGRWKPIPDWNSQETANKRWFKHNQWEQ